MGLTDFKGESSAVRPQSPARAGWLGSWVEDSSHLHRKERIAPSEAHCGHSLEWAEGGEQIGRLIAGHPQGVCER